MTIHSLHVHLTILIACASDIVGVASITTNTNIPINRGILNGYRLSPKYHLILVVVLLRAQQNYMHNIRLLLD